MELKPELDQLGVKIIAIGTGTKLFAEKFITGLPFTGDVYLDSEASSFKALNLPRWSMMCIMGRFMMNMTSMGFARSHKATYASSDMKGDGQQSGGVFVVSQQGEIVYKFLEAEAATDEFADNEAVMKEVKKLLQK